MSSGTQETSEFKPGQEVWVIAWDGPQKASFVKEYRRAKKALIESGEIPQLVEMANVFADRTDCYRQAAAKENDAAMTAMKRSLEYLQRATEPEKGS
jgi:hypothetical protein